MADASNHLAVDLYEPSVDRAEELLADGGGRYRGLVFAAAAEALLEECGATSPRCPSHDHLVTEAKRCGFILDEGAGVPAVAEASIAADVLTPGRGVAQALDASPRFASCCPTLPRMRSHPAVRRGEADPPTLTVATCRAELVDQALQVAEAPVDPVAGVSDEDADVACAGSSASICS